MKTMIFVSCLLLVASIAYAKPERLAMKNEEKRSKERIAETNIKQIDTARIQDPEARRAIKEILNYLNLSAKN